MRIGAHVSTRGGVLSAIRAASDCGAEAVQIFVSNPRGWAAPRVSRAETQAFREAFAAADLGPLFVHAPYVVNVASSNPDFLGRSVELARLTVAVSSALGAEGSVVHAGSGGKGDRREALARAAASMQTIAAEGDCRLVVELTAGTAGSVAATIPEAVALFDAVGDPRLGLCLDTCHLFAVGYALDEPEGIAECFEELRTSGLAGRLRMIHANDAKYGRGSHRDRHEHIGEGHIGVEGFFETLRRPEVQDLPFVVETPGSLEDHARNITTLRRLAA